MATDLNHVVLIGRWTRSLGDSPNDYGTTITGQTRANVSIAVNRSRKNADGTWTDEASFFDVTIWGKTAENLKPYLTKGKQIAVEGYLKQDRWTDKETGGNRSKISIQASNVHLLGGRTDGGQQTGGASGTYQPSNSFVANSMSNSQSDFGGDAYGDAGGNFPDDIPF